jgi:hypothetical protein
MLAFLIQRISVAFHRKSHFFFITTRVPMIHNEQAILHPQNRFGGFSLAAAPRLSLQRQAAPLQTGLI